jgi:hypothetical protein
MGCSVAVSDQNCTLSQSGVPHMVPGWDLDVATSLLARWHRPDHIDHRLVGDGSILVSFCWEGYYPGVV